MGAACVIPQTANDIRPEVKIEEVIRLMAILLEREPDKLTVQEWYGSAIRAAFQEGKDRGDMPKIEELLSEQPRFAKFAMPFKSRPPPCPTEIARNDRSGSQIT